MKNMNLLSVSKLDPDKMNEIVGGGKSDTIGGVACNPSNCKNDVHISVNNALENMRINNPPIEN